MANEDNCRGRTLCSSVLDAIDRTPLVELSRLTGSVDGRILAKLEFMSPGFSKKDRIALQMVEDSETAGLLAREEGIFAGFSSGANIAGALKLLEGRCDGMTIVVLLNDSGLKYLSTALWE